jgi:hypothetical protein
VTSKPFLIKVCARLEPINPAPPVIATLFISQPLGQFHGLYI